MGMRFSPPPENALHGGDRPQGPAKQEQQQQQSFSDFCVQHDLPLGTLTIRPAQPEDVGPASVLLTRAFAGSLQGVPIGDARQYCQDSLTQPPRGVLLVARLQPTDLALLPPGQATRLCATVGLSFCRDTREDFPTLQPPDDAVYLSNMAVDAKLRRRGLARKMLAAAEALVASAGQREIYLHVRLADAPAQQLYTSSGFEVLTRDNALLAKVRGITPRALMRKRL
ncbi:hypothetical protein ABPG77_001297 [Micractinium sp. CCAP 211/92]